MKTAANRIAQRSAAMVASLAILAGAAPVVGCGDAEDQVNRALEQGEKAAQNGLDRAERAVQQARRDVPEQAQKQIDEAKKDIDKTFDRAKDGGD